MAGVGAAVSTEEDGDQLCDLVQGERLGKRRGAQGKAQGWVGGGGEGGMRRGTFTSPTGVFIVCQPPLLFLPVLMISLWRS